MERPVLSPDPPLLTLDTSCISALANSQTSVPVAEVEALDALVDGAQVGELRLQLTASYERDFERWTDTAGRAQRRAWLASAPTMARVGGIFRFDASVWDGPDVLAGDDDVELDRRLRGILVPSLKLADVPGHDEAPGGAAKAFSDIDHLIAHRRSARCSSSRWMSKRSSGEPLAWPNWRSTSAFRPTLRSAYRQETGRSTRAEFRPEAARTQTPDLGSRANSPTSQSQAPTTQRARLGRLPGAGSDLFPHPFRTPSFAPHPMRTPKWAAMAVSNWVLWTTADRARTCR